MVWKAVGLLVLWSLAFNAKGEENCPFCIDFTEGSSLVYQLPRSILAGQPKWNMGEALPIPLPKLCQIALDKSNPAGSRDADGWKIQHVQFWRVKTPGFRGNNPRFEATTDIPPDLQDRWFCVFQLSNFKDFTGEWWKNQKYAVVMLDGTYVEPTALKK